MQIYIVSIEDESSPRLVKFLSQNFFKSSDVNYKKIGIKGIDLPTKQYFEQAVKGRIKPLTPGELGCTLSHLKALELFLATKDEYALILEDDAILPENLSYQNLKSELKKLELPSNVLFSLGGIQMKECQKVRGKIKEYTIFNKAILEVVPDFYHRVNYTVSYIVDRVMAQTLVNYHQPIRKADDWSYLFDFSPTSHIFMSFIVDHPVIESGEANLQLSSIESERASQCEIMKSKYGTGIRKNISKLINKKYSF
ncbi:glycosyltransferase family 25 protein [Acinetobacter baumannii]|uniref:glycosyltransferase family 25 protein n=1 Tax=Acinetobacter baumannii TaxID=470 RepID=UPI00044C5121|nr:glycosyltransferase family 25 protein [Acinetobacter baumannii]EXE37093.1 glycosyltransferase 25 family protein [Acinetobacter baumannii 1546444]MBU3147102.1 glycosyltransferase family 25 protein [Acinetobacter baumannii]MCT9290406.1 glycosyltransferase family 25 protein [Acinetobacter baumannii]MCV2390943.1 glycosyltransferase family 25 protein [Acinetobacter baumannii]MDC4331935.1 glycosyltransferase family 25 protein [Acinetobacter baumannii]